MSQRNPMNDRYQSDAPKGQTKKSAASMKPKSKAASSVYVRSAKKTPQERKAERKAERAKQAELNSKYYNPPTEEYKRLRRWWWIALIAAIVFTVLGLFAPQIFPGMRNAQWGFIVPAYACIIIALWLDLSKIRKVRQAYQIEMAKKDAKIARRHKVTYAANLEAAKRDAEKAARPGLITRIGMKFGMKKRGEEEVASAEPSAEEVADAAAQAKAEEDARKPIAQLKAEREAEKKAEREAERAAESSDEAKASEN